MQLLVSYKYFWNQIIFEVAQGAPKARFANRLILPRGGVGWGGSATNGAPCLFCTRIREVPLWRRQPGNYVAQSILGILA